MHQLFTFGGNETLLGEFERWGVRFIVVGGLAVQFYVPERHGDDLDLLIEQSPENASRLFLALPALHVIPKFPESLISAPTERVHQLPLKQHHYADIVTSGKDIDFPAEWEQSQVGLIFQHQVRFASRDLLVRMKRKAGREKDLCDIELLQCAG